jgi:hypothetical protein
MERKYGLLRNIWMNFIVGLTAEIKANFRKWDEIIEEKGIKVDYLHCFL